MNLNAQWRFSPLTLLPNALRRNYWSPRTPCWWAARYPGLPWVTNPVSFSPSLLIRVLVHFGFHQSEQRRRTTWSISGEGKMDLPIDPPLRRHNGSLLCWCTRGNGWWPGSNGVFVSSNSHILAIWNLLNYRASESEEEELLYVFNAIMKLDRGFVTVLEACKHKPTALLTWITKVSVYMRSQSLIFTYQNRSSNLQMQLDQMTRESSSPQFSTTFTKTQRKIQDLERRWTTTYPFFHPSRRISEDLDTPILQAFFVPFVF